MYFGVESAALGPVGATGARPTAARACSGSRPRRRGCGASRRASSIRRSRAGDVADRRADQLEEVALDPVAREVVRDGEDEAVLVELDARRPRANQFRNVVSLRAPLSRADTSLHRLSAVSSILVLHPARQLLPREPDGEHSSGRRMTDTKAERRFAGDFTLSHDPSTAVERSGETRRSAHSLLRRCACGQAGGRSSSILAVRPAPDGRFCRFRPVSQR